nr:esterase-like activity of phytase family protein [uncultured Sphingosinicella sp.]
MRKLLLLAAAVPLLATFAPASLYVQAERPRTPVLWAEPIALREGAPESRRVGALRMMEGWWLRSNHPWFGGVSAVNVVDRKVLALSDGGVLMRFDMPHKAARIPLSLSRLADAPGPNKKQRDTEAMVIDGGRAWVAFERVNAVFRYRLADWRSDASSRPQAMRRWSANRGSEAMVRLRDGRFLIFSEGFSVGEGLTEVLLFNGDPAAGAKAVRLAYRPPEGYLITDAAQLPDGRLLFLNRRLSIFDGILAKLTVAEKPELREGAVLSGREIAHFQPPVTTDNYEALSIAEENGRTILWIASDDNFMGIQRTLLLKFALNP